MRDMHAQQCTGCSDDGRPVVNGRVPDCRGGHRVVPDVCQTLRCAVCEDGFFLHDRECCPCVDSFDNCVACSASASTACDGRHVLSRVGCFPVQRHTPEHYSGGVAVFEELILAQTTGAKDARCTQSGCSSSSSLWLSPFLVSDCGGCWWCFEGHPEVREEQQRAKTRVFAMARSNGVFVDAGDSQTSS